MSGYSRSGPTPLNLGAESTIEAAAAEVQRCGAVARLWIDANGVLEGNGCVAAKSWQQLDPTAMSRALAVNAIGGRHSSCSTSFRCCRASP